MSFTKIENAVQVYTLLASHVEALSADPDSGARHAVLRMKLTMLDCLASLEAIQAAELAANVGDPVGVIGYDFREVYLETVLELIQLRNDIMNTEGFADDSTNALMDQNAADMQELTERGYTITDLLSWQMYSTI